MAGRDDALSYLSSKDIPPPRPDRVMVCHDFGCAVHTPVQLSAGDIADLRRVLSGSRTPAAERTAIGRAIALMERKVGPVAGTSRDRGGLDPLTPEEGQQDCIDESTNTTQYLVLFDDLGLLKFHQPGAPASRGVLLDLRYPHQTAVMVERSGGREWVVDSWPRANGELPDIMPLDQWRNAERRWRRPRSSAPRRRRRHPSGQGRRPC
jgi:hypothetical protein